MSSFSFNQDQEVAMEAINSWLHLTEGLNPWDYGDDWMFCLAGFAGTGKTFLLSKLIESLRCKYHCVAPTGKAASVLMSKLKGITVSTIHSILYLPVDDNVEHIQQLIAKLSQDPENEELKKQVQEEIEKINSKGPGFSSREVSKIDAGDLVIVDESSMVDTRLRDDLKATRCRAIFVGDAGQLPPVGSSGWFLKAKPNANLKEIQRQSLDSPIIRLSMDIREGYVKPREWRRKEGCGIWKTSEVDPNSWKDADQILTGSNASRHKINRFIRKQLGHNRSIFPVEGEKLICLKNDNKRIPQFINGTIFKSLGDAEIYDGKTGHEEVGILDLCYDGVDLSGVHFYPFHCRANYSKDAIELPRDMRKGLMELDFAYAITVHKSQGSEWDDVIVADDEIQKNDPIFRRRWLYTAVTRAKTSLKIIQADKP